MIRRVWPYAATAGVLVLAVLWADERRASRWYQERASKTADAEQEAARYRRVLEAIADSPGAPDWVRQWALNATKEAS